MGDENPQPVNSENNKISKQFFSKQNLCIVIIASVIIILLSLNIYLTVAKEKPETLSNTGFSFLDPAISNMDISNFLKTRNDYVASYKPLKIEIEQILSQSDGKFGVYFEDLEFHAWFGVNEREPFRPASLLKITTVAAILKQVEEGELSLDTKIVLNEDDLNYRFGNLYEKEGSTLTIKKLIETALVYSDNTAIKKLHQYMTSERWVEARLVMGLPYASVDESAAGTALTPKEFAGVFRSLYYSGYLSRAFSNWVLMLLSETEFNEGIPAGVPENIAISHKIGAWLEEGTVNDCGIVYAKKPYILCIMSEGISAEEGNDVIKEISKTVYDYVSNS